jgi:sterol 3beta-glucosyltransferase
MNQSIFGLIAAAGSRVDFNTRFDDASSDEEDGDHSKDSSSSQDLSQTVILPPQQKDARRGHKKRLSSGHRLLKSLSTLPRRKGHKRESTRLSAPTLDSSDDARESAELSATAMALEKEDGSRLAPVMSRMLQARAEVASRPSYDLERPSTDMLETDAEHDSSALARRLKEIFEFEEPEQVIEGKHMAICLGFVVSD